MKISRIKLIAAALTMGLSLSTVALAPAYAEATQADIDYSTQVSQLSQTFASDTADWGAALAGAPTLAFGSKWKAYKAKVTKSSDKFLVTIKKLKALTPGPGFTKSGPMLVTAMGFYESAVTTLKTGATKNDVKAVAKAGKVAAQATTAFLAWAKVYPAEVAALNG